VPQLLLTREQVLAIADAFFERGNDADAALITAREVRADAFVALVAEDDSTNVATFSVDTLGDVGEEV
jgi:hypothetical protein